jgi:ribosomal protein S12
MEQLTESNVRQKALTVEQQAEAVQIVTNTDFENAAAILKNIKTSKQKFIDFFAPSKKATDAAHKAVVANEKACTGPCDKAESIIKRKMLSFSQKIEAERRAAEEAARKAAQEESDRLLAEAAKAEESGDTMQATASMTMAEQVDSIKPAVQVAAPKVTGVSTKKVWKVRVNDAKAVPAYVSDVCVRPIDERALLQLRKLNPGIEIPGVTFFQTEQLAVR